MSEFLLSIYPATMILFPFIIAAAYLGGLSTPRHAHKWEIIKECKLLDGNQRTIGRVFYQRCSACGNVRRRAMS